MRITSFVAQGYKNLTARVTLEGLDAVNIIHGDNDVGKSNLLEAVELAFRLLGTGGYLPLERPRTLDPAEFEKVTGRPLRHAFNLTKPIPIDLEFALESDDREFESAGIQPLLDCSRITVGQRLEPDVGGGVQWRIRRFEFADGTNAAVRADDLTQERALI